MDDIKKHEELVEYYLDHNDTEGAIKSLLFLVAKYAKQKNMDKAEELRERIIEIDPMALSEALRANDFIEEAKRKPIDKHHREIWDDLYSRLTENEAQALYSELKEATFPADTYIFKQGEMNSCLYFINEGHAKHIFMQGDKESFISKIGPGSVAGDDTFFNALVCTTSVITLSRVASHYLERDILHKWKKTHPALENKVKEFCQSHVQVHELLKNNAMDRRSQRRAPLQGKVYIKLVNDAGQPVGKTLVGTLSDLSPGGISFYIKSRQRDSAQLLLGRNLNVRFQLPPEMHDVTRNGLTIGVRYHADGYNMEQNEYSVHLKFAEELNSKLISAVEKYSRQVSNF